MTSARPPLPPGLTPRRSTDFIVVVASETVPSPKLGVKDLDRMDRQRGLLMVGFHFVIKTDGEVQTGRPLDAVGANTLGFNDRSVSICLIGGSPESGVLKKKLPTGPQAASLGCLLEQLRGEYPTAQVKGLRDLPGARTENPFFDVLSTYHQVPYR